MEHGRQGMRRRRPLACALTINTATHWERGQFIEFISPVRSEMMRSIYEIFNSYLNCRCR